MSTEFNPMEGLLADLLNTWEEEPQAELGAEPESASPTQTGPTLTASAGDRTAGHPTTEADEPSAPALPVITARSRPTELPVISALKRPSAPTEMLPSASREPLFREPIAPTPSPKFVSAPLSPFTEPAPAAWSPSEALPSGLPPLERETASEGPAEADRTTEPTALPVPVVPVPVVPEPVVPVLVVPEPVAPATVSLAEPAWPEDPASAAACAAILARMEQEFADWEPVIVPPRRSRLASDVPRFVVFAVREMLFAIPIERVLETDRLTPITPLPGAPMGLKGLTNLRGDVVPVIDLREVLGWTPAENASARRMLVIHDGNRQPLTALLVDQVKGLAAFANPAWKSAEMAGAHGAEGFVEAVAERDQEWVSRLNLDRVLDETHLPSLAAA